MDTTAPLRSVEQAQDDILSHCRLLPAETVSLSEALGRVLAADITADRDAPPFANSAMDGYAVRAADLPGASADNPVRLAIIERVAAGAMPTRAVEPGTAVRIMTGAPLPDGADSIVPFEDTDELRNPTADAVLMYVAPSLGASVRPAGEDMRAGATVLRDGTPITPGALGVLATVGAARVSVRRRPKVAILATGDELVDVDQVPGPGQIRNSNGYANAAQVLAAGAEPVLLPIARDNEASLLASIDQGVAAGVDLFLTSGGVSVGDYDIVKDVLRREGQLEFWRVRMKPGKPLAFGRLRGIPLIGLPGNPVSAMVCFELFARPALLKMQGHPAIHRPVVPARIVGGGVEHADRRQYLRVIVRLTAGGFEARLTGGQGSGLVTSMARANGLLIVPEGPPEQAVEPLASVMLLDWPEQA